MIICENFFLTIIICENLFLFVKTCFHLCALIFISENLFLFMLIFENLYDLLWELIFLKSLWKEAGVWIPSFLKRNCNESHTSTICLTLFRIGFFRAAHGWGRPKKPLLPNICHTYPTMMKRGTVIPSLKKIQKI